MNHTDPPIRSGPRTFAPAFELHLRHPTGAHLRAVVAAIFSALGLNAYALPTAGQISVGQGNIAQTGSAMTVTQQSQNLAINWQTFGIGATESVTFAQPNTSAIALNRVLGADPTQIYGQLSANGQVWLLNPNGVLFGGGAQVNVGGLVTSTLNISDADFLAGKRTFTGSGGSVINQGSITATDGGYVAMLGGKVSNEGVIQARLGTVALGAGNKVTLDFAGDKLLNLQVDQGAVNALALNKQLIQADGGTVLLSARAADTLLNTVVNNTGIIEARTIDTHSGTIKLLGDMNGGTVQVAGTLDASAPNGGDGGQIETSGAQVKVSDGAIVTTAAPYGQTGEWLIDPTNFLIAPAGGDVTGAALGSELNSTNVTILSSNGAMAGSGDVKVNDNVTWNSANSLTLSAYNNIKVVKTITNLGTGSVTLRADDTGNCVSGSRNCGTVSFTPMAHVTVNGGAVNIYYNPAGSSNRADANGNGPSYSNPTDYSGHVTLNSGSTLNAWMLVNDVNQLQAMNTNLAGDYALGRDIDATATASWNGGAGFVPVGPSYLGTFGGVFDGLSHTIIGLTINLPASSNVGLFGYSSGVVRNTGLLDGSVTGDYLVGGLVGDNEGTVSNSCSTGTVSGSANVGGLVGYSAGTVSNSYSTGAVNGSGGVGGLVGYNRGGLRNSYSTSDVNGTDLVGGLVGSNGGFVRNSYSTGAVTGSNYVGGLVGQNFRVVTNSYSAGAVNGSSRVGGLVGYNNGGLVSNSYSTGAVTGSNYVGGLIGFTEYNGTVNNSYWDMTTSGQSTSAGGTGLTTAQMMQQASFTGFDFTNTWWMSEGNTRPFLRMEYSTTITNAHQLQLIALNPDASYTLAHDIGMSELSNPSGLWNVSTGFVPLNFDGQFDGNGHVISGLIINRPAASGVGLFGVNEGSIANVGLIDASVIGADFVGGLVGDNAFGPVNNSYSTGSISGADCVGGLVGGNLAGTVNSSHSSAAVNGANSVGGLVGVSSHSGVISDSYSTGSVSGADDVGGLAGDNGHGMVSDSYSTAAVSGNNYVGGLVGASAGTISNSYSTGAVSGNNNVGGLVGLSTYYDWVIKSYSSGAISGNNYVGGLVGESCIGCYVIDSYSVGAVSGTSYVGGLVGRNYGTVSTSYSAGAVSGSSYVGGLVGFADYGKVNNSYWDITTSGQTTSAGGTGLTDTQMKQQSSFVGFDFVNTWGIIEGVSYPFLLEP